MLLKLRSTPGCCSKIPPHLCVVLSQQVPRIPEGPHWDSPRQVTVPEGCARASFPVPGARGSTAVFAFTRQCFLLRTHRPQGCPNPSLQDALSNLGSCDRLTGPMNPITAERPVAVLLLGSPALSPSGSPAGSSLPDVFSRWLEISRLQAPVYSGTEMLPVTFLADLSQGQLELAIRRSHHEGRVLGRMGG